MGDGCTPAAEPSVPIHIGGHSNAGLRRALLRGDGWIGAQGDLAAVREVIGRLGELREQLGDDVRVPAERFEVKLTPIVAPTVDAMEELAARTLPEGMATEWTGISLEQKQAGKETLVIFALGLVFVFLVLAAQYESFVLPLVIILAVPLAILGGLGLQVLRGLVNDVFCQVGLVMLVGLASKNAILIVEFAEQLRRAGRAPKDAVIAAASIRLRPILMTSVAFLLGVVPLMLAHGAGAAARNSLGTTVFGGMLVSTVVNLVFIPAIYVLVRRPGRAVAAGPGPTSHADA